MSQLTISRKELYRGFKLSKLCIVIDDIHSFEIENENEISIQLENGYHTIYIDYLSKNANNSSQNNCVSRKLLTKSKKFYLSTNSTVQVSFASLGIKLKSSDLSFINKIDTPSLTTSVGKSAFTGKLLGLIGISLLQFFMIVFSLGLATPWAVCKKELWIANHTFIDGNQLIFEGRGGDLFKHFIIWFLLTIVTLGIYGFWLTIKMKSWVIEHTHIKNT